MVNFPVLFKLACHATTESKEEGAYHRSHCLAPFVNPKRGFVIKETAEGNSVTERPEGNVEGPPEISFGERTETASSEGESPEKEIEEGYCK